MTRSFTVWTLASTRKVSTSMARPAKVLLFDPPPPPSRGVLLLLCVVVVHSWNGWFWWWFFSYVFCGASILQTPNFSASARIAAMYLRGSANSSAVGRNVGASRAKAATRGGTGPEVGPPVSSAIYSRRFDSRIGLCGCKERERKATMPMSLSLSDLLFPVTT